jgi:DNA-binding GntR family transcriptional regulator
MKTHLKPHPLADPDTSLSKEEYVAEYLREGILSGAIARGTRLKQAELAARLGLSITPVREAFKLLVAEGFVLGATHRGVVVPATEPANLTELASLRMVLEQRLIISAMRQMTLRDMERTERLAQAFEIAVSAGDMNAALDANYRFHRFLYALASETLTLRFARTLWARYPFDALLTRPERTARALEEHARILDAVVSRDQDAAASAVRRHIQSGFDELAGRTEPLLPRPLNKPG